MKKVNSAKDLFKFIVERLQVSVGSIEAEPVALLLIEHLTGFTRTDIVVDKTFKNASEIVEEAEKILLKTDRGVPIQYAINKAWFYDRPFYVDQNVLIPRQETEELVNLILKKKGKLSQNVLDIGTGSGCIPITLKLEAPNFRVTGLDISEGALGVAKRNATALGVNINWVKMDILKQLPGDCFDIIVSNPPYIPQNESEEMDTMVTAHEPSLALFVPNNNPLIFYERIIDLHSKIGKENSVIFFEIHEGFGQKLTDLAIKKGFKITLSKDLNGKDRIAELHK